MKNKGLIRPLGEILKQQSGTRKERLYWSLDVYDNAFRFFLSDDLPTEWFVAHDKLASVTAYKGCRPPDMFLLLEQLEKLAEGYKHIMITPQILLIPKRISQSPGLVLEVDGRGVMFVDEPQLRKINFLDFYNVELKPKLKGSVMLTSHNTGMLDNGTEYFN